MTDQKTLQISVNKFRLAYNALNGLGLKTLPNPEAEMRVALMVKGYQKTFDATESVRKKIEAAHKKKVEGKEKFVNIIEMQKKFEAFDAQMITIKAPRKLITKDDLPKTVGKDDEDEKNRAQNAAIMAQLGPFFDFQATGEDAEFLDGDMNDEELAALNKLTEESTT